MSLPRTVAKVRYASCAAASFSQCCVGEVFCPMTKRSNSIFGLVAQYAKQQFDRPSVQPRTLYLLGIGAASIAGIATMTMLAPAMQMGHHHGGYRGHCTRHAMQRHAQMRARYAQQETQQQAQREIQQIVRVHTQRAYASGTQCQTLVVRNDGHAVAPCMPRWMWDSMSNQGRTSFVRPMDGQSFSLLPSLASNGDGYGMAFTVLTETHADIYFQRLSPGGTPVGTPVKVSETTDGQAALLPSIAWTGDGYAIAWTGVENEESVDVFMARVDPSGVRKGAVTKVSTSNELDLAARVAWSGSRIGVGWFRFNGEDTMTARFAVYDSAGSRVGAESNLRDVLALGLPTLLPSEGGFVFGYNSFELRRGQTQLLLQKVGNDGRGAAAFVANADRHINGSVAMAADAAGVFNFVWEDGMYEEETNHLAYGRASVSRVEQRRALLTNGRSASVQPAIAVAPDGTTGTTWTDNRSGRMEVFFARVGRNGKLQGEATRLTRAGTESIFPTLAWGGREYLAAWTEAANDRVGIAIARISPDGNRPANEATTVISVAPAR